MSKFCIDLEGVMLPDAIAAVVEAWYDAQNVDNLIEQKCPMGKYQPGMQIEVRDSIYESAWKRGWVFYKAYDKKVGICESDKWNFELNLPSYVVDGGGQYCGKGDVYSSRESGCRMKQYQNIRRMVAQPWEKQLQRQQAG